MTSLQSHSAGNCLHVAFTLNSKLTIKPCIFGVLSFIIMLILLNISLLASDTKLKVLKKSSFSKLLQSTKY